MNGNNHIKEFQETRFNYRVLVTPSWLEPLLTQTYVGIRVAR